MSLPGRENPALRKIQLVLLALLLFDALFYIFAISPLKDADRAQAQQLSNLRKQVDDRSRQLAKITAISQKVEKARTEGDQLLADITLPRRTAYSIIVSELDQAGKAAGVELRDRAFDSEPIEGSDTLSMLSVTAGLQGSYENLVRFLNLLDKSERFLIIESLGATPQQTQQATDKLNVTVKLDTFTREM